jgi:Ser/Thr protein kinase RdoA (MazF antagonist)
MKPNTETFPVIVSILAPEAIVNDVLPGFGISDALACEFSSGGFNHTYRIKTSHGKTFYLRAYRPRWRKLDDIKYELDVLNHLRRKGFPAIQPVENQDGCYFCAVQAPEGTRYLVLFTEAPGGEVSYENEPAEKAQHYGRAVANLHNALDGFTSPYVRFHLDLKHFIDQPLSNIQPFLVNRPEDWNYLLHFAESLRQGILTMPAEMLEQGFCHGDLQGYHVNVGPDGTLTFYDFDCGGYGFRAYDLAVFLWCCRLESAVAARWQPFLNGYQEARQINQRDVDAIPLFVCARYLWHMGVHTQNSRDWGIDFLNDSYFNAHINDLRQAEKDYLA